MRVIRDALEREGHNPLMFFLKCLEDESSELPELLRREIEARTWFVLCDSPHSRSSRWVQEEVRMIESLEGKVFTVVDVTASPQEVVGSLLGISKRATVFISSSTEDLGCRMVAEREERAGDSRGYVPSGR